MSRNFTWPINPSSSGPVEYIRDGTSTTVTKDTSTPGNTRALPVEVVSTSGDVVDFATATNQTIEQTRIGSLTETAPASDTASSGLNGRLQRIAQRLTSLIALLPLSLGQKTMAESLAVTLASDQTALPLSTGAATAANQVTEQGLVGSLTETAPATDTASSGLNGRLQRIAQRLTSLIGLFPATLGQKTMANSFAVVIASDQSSVGVTGPLTDAQLRATAVPVSGPLTDAQLRATAVPVSVSGVSTAANQVTQTTALTSIQTQTVNLQNTIAAEGGAQPTHGVVVMGHNGSGTARHILTDGSGRQIVNINTLPAPSVPVATTVKQQAITVGTSAVRLTTDGLAPSATRRVLKFIVEPGGGDDFFVGSSSVASSGVNRGIRVYPGTLYDFENDAGDYYIIAGTAGQTVFVIEQE